MSGKTIGDEVVTNMVWRFAERCGAQIVTFVVSIVLARLLDPTIYGTVALVTVFTSILQVFVDSGLGNSLIQKKDAGDIEFSTVFFFNITFCIILYFALFLMSPLIASFYGRPELTNIVRVLGLTIVISGVKNVQQAYVSKNMIFKKFFYATIFGTIFSAAVGIMLAVWGFGVWAVVFQHLTNTFVDTVILWITVKWRPRWLFSWSALKGLFSYGWKFLASSLLNTVYMEIRQLIIGKVYSSDSLGLYNKGRQIPNLLVTTINTSIDSVLFPAMSKKNDNSDYVRKMTRSSIRVSGYIMWPLMLGLAVIAEPLIRVLLTDKWIGCVPYLRVFCVSFAFQPIHTSNLNAIKALGRSDIFLKLEIIKKSIGLAILFAVMHHGVMAIAYSLLLYNVVVQIVNSWPNRKLLKYTYVEQLKDFVPFLLYAVLMSIPVYYINYIVLPDLLKLCIQVLLGIIIYLFISVAFKVKEFDYVKGKVVNLIKR